MASKKLVSKSKLAPITKGAKSSNSDLIGDLKELKQMADSASARASLLQSLVKSLTKK